MMPNLSRRVKRKLKKQRLGGLADTQTLVRQSAKVSTESYNGTVHGALLTRRGIGVSYWRKSCSEPRGRQEMSFGSPSAPKNDALTRARNEYGLTERESIRMSPALHDMLSDYLHSTPGQYENFSDMARVVLLRGVQALRDEMEDTDAFMAANPRLQQYEHWAAIETEMRQAEIEVQQANDLAHDLSRLYSLKTSPERRERALDRARSFLDTVDGGEAAEIVDAAVSRYERHSR